MQIHSDQSVCGAETTQIWPIETTQSSNTDTPDVQHGLISSGTDRRKKFNCSFNLRDIRVLETRAAASYVLSTIGRKSWKTSKSIPSTKPAVGCSLASFVTIGPALISFTCVSPPVSQQPLCRLLHTDTAGVRHTLRPEQEVFFFHDGAACSCSV